MYAMGSANGGKAGQTQEQGIAGQEAMQPAPAPSGAEAIATLKELGQMRNEGLLTEAEFQRAKEKFLA
jgi:hypothetical protein